MAVRKVGTARLVREIGRGGMGVVYLAEQEPLGRKVAIKELPPDVAASKDMVERFHREARAYAALRHEAIPAIHDLVEKNDGLYMVTELVDGADLARVLAQGGPLPPECVATVGARVAAALDHVHLHGLLHRDIKPSNIMIASDGSVKLMDFGIALDGAADALTRQGMVVGSPPYLAPETLGGQKADTRSDTWALGITLWELLTAERPFKGADAQSLFAAIRGGRRPKLRRKIKGMHRGLARIIETCLELDPGKRWRDARTLSAALAGVATELLGDTAPHVRLVSMMTHRGLIQDDEVDKTVIDAGQLAATRLLDASFSVEVVLDEPPARWPWAVLAALGAGGTAYGTYLAGLWHLPPLP